MDTSNNVHFEWIEISDEDLKTVLQWRNDPVSREMSFHTAPWSWEKFRARFIHTFFRLPELPPLFAFVEGQKAAFVGFEPFEKEGECLISVIVAPEARGRGIATKVLKAIVPFAARRGFPKLVAEIKPKNLPSKKAFQAAGFQFVKSTHKDITDLGIREPIEVYISAFPVLKNTPLPPIFVIAEAGSNWHTGDVQQGLPTAKALIHAAAEAGADAVKFQLFHPEGIYVPNAGKSDYLASAGTKKDIFSLFAEMAMPKDMVLELVGICHSAGIEFMATPFSPEEFLFLDPLVKRHKIASYEMNHLHLLSLSARSQKPLLLSTGASTEEEVDWAVRWFRSQGGRDLTLLQCTAQYPADPQAMNLRAIPHLAKRFKTSVGLSDHSIDPFLAPLMAAALGATVIEKHFTLSRHLSGPDHAYSLEPKELKAMVQALREGGRMLGSGQKEVQATEQELRLFARRGIQAIRDISAGEVLKEEENLAILRPGKQKLGLHSRFLSLIEGHRAKKTIPLGQGIQLDDVDFTC